MNENEVKEVVKAGIKAAARAKSIGKGLAVIGLGATIVGKVAFHAPGWCIGWTLVALVLSSLD